MKLLLQESLPCGTGRRNRITDFVARYRIVGIHEAIMFPDYQARPLQIEKMIVVSPTAKSTHDP